MKLLHIQNNSGQLKGLYFSRCTHSIPLSMMTIENKGQLKTTPDNFTLCTTHSHKVRATHIQTQGVVVLCTAFKKIK